MAAPHWYWEPAAQLIPQPSEEEEEGGEGAGASDETLLMT